MSQNSVAKFLRDANVRIVRSSNQRPPPILRRQTPPSVVSHRATPIAPKRFVQPVLPAVTVRRPPSRLVEFERPRPASPVRSTLRLRRPRRRAITLPSLTRNAKGQLLLQGVRCTPKNFRKRRLAYYAKSLGWKPRAGVTKARLCEIIRKRANLPRITLIGIKRDILRQKKRRISERDLDKYAREARAILFALGRPSRDIQRLVAREVAKNK